MNFTKTITYCVQGALCTATMRSQRSCILKMYENVKVPYTPTNEQTNEWTAGRHVASLGRFLIMIPIRQSKIGSNCTPLFICVPRNQFRNVFGY